MCVRAHLCVHVCVYVHTDACKDQELEAGGIYRKVRDLIWVLGIELETST